jgi:hypothetical protein
MHIESRARRIRGMRAAIQAERKMTSESDRWIQQSRVQQCNLMDTLGKCQIPVDWMGAPTQDMGIRTRNQEHVHKIFDSIGKYGVQPRKRIVGFVCKEDLEAAGMDPENPQFDVSMSVPPSPIYTIIGYHFVAAIQMWHAEKPNNSNYKTVPVELIVSSKEERNLTLMKHAAALDNMVRTND